MKSPIVLKPTLILNGQCMSTLKLSAFDKDCGISKGRCGLSISQISSPHVSSLFQEAQYPVCHNLNMFREHVQIAWLTQQFSVIKRLCFLFPTPRIRVSWQPIISERADGKSEQRRGKLKIYVLSSNRGAYGGNWLLKLNWLYNVEQGERMLIIMFTMLWFLYWNWYTEPHLHNASCLVYNV